jgi:hypothetical protein
MTDALTWAVAGSYAAQEGIKFIFAQVSDALDSLRQKKTEQTVKSSPPPLSFEDAPAEIEIQPSALAGHEEVAGRLLNEVEAALVAVGKGKELGANDLAAIAELRELAESLTGTSLNFPDERRATPVVDVRAKIAEIEGRLIGISVVGADLPGWTKAHFEIGRVSKGGEATLFEIREP